MQKVKHPLWRPTWRETLRLMDYDPTPVIVSERARALRLEYHDDPVMLAEVNSAYATFLAERGLLAKSNALPGRTALGAVVGRKAK